jgi:hypothetical protein
MGIIEQSPTVLGLWGNLWGPLCPFKGKAPEDLTSQGQAHHA